MNRTQFLSVLLTGSIMAAGAEAKVIYDVSSASAEHCQGARYGVHTTTTDFGGACGKLFDFQDGTQLTLENDAADTSLWTASLTGTAINPFGKIATIDLLFTGFRETYSGYYQSGGAVYDPSSDTPDIDFFTDIAGTIDVDGEVFNFDHFAGDTAFQYGLGANAMSTSEFGGSAWIQGDDSLHWDLNMNFAEVPEPSSMGLLGLGLLSLAGLRKRRLG